MVNSCNMYSKIFVIALFFCIGTSIADDDDPIVTLPYGKIQGHALLSANNNVYYAFQEIPYASPPVGDLRFKPAVAPKSWDGVLETKQNTKICYQAASPYIADNVTSSEDCLYLNVYTPQKPDGSSETLLPVLVWIHGGAFRGGDGTFGSVGPQLLIDYDIVIVAINYRLGPLGFLTTSDDVIPGNLGLKDQNFALKWIKENINLFGGDPEKITISGQSAGGMSSGYQVISKKSAGLFRAAILESGTPISPACYQAVPRQMAFELGKQLDATFSSDDSQDLLNLLLKASAADITAVDLPLPEKEYIGDVIWTPVMEPEGDDAFISAPMHDDIQSGNINQVPIIIGFTSEEQISFASTVSDAQELKDKAKLFDEDSSKLVTLVFNIPEEEEKTAGNELKKIYTDDIFENDFGAMVRFMSDSRFTTPAARHAHLQSQYTDVYLYQFSYKGELGGTHVDLEGVDASAVGHGEEIPYIWYSDMNDPSDYPKEDILTRNRLLKMWTNFVKYLNPTPEEDSLLENVTWPKVTPDNFGYLNINATLEVKVDPKEYKKWEKVVATYAQPPFISY